MGASPLRGCGRAALPHLPEPRGEPHKEPGAHATPLKIRRTTCAVSISGFPTMAYANQQFHRSAISVWWQTRLLTRPTHQRCESQTDIFSKPCRLITLIPVEDVCCMPIVIENKLDLQIRVGLKALQSPSEALELFERQRSILVQACLRQQEVSQCFHVARI